MSDKRVENILKIIGDELANDYLDTAYGANRALNGATFGGFHRLGNALGYDAEMNGYLSLLPPEERQQRQTLGDLAQYGGEALGTGYGLYNGLNGALNFAGWAEHQAGKHNLTKQLKRGGEFSDVNFGKISRQKLGEINELRRQLNVPEITNRRVTVPESQVEHIYERRILDNGYTPDEAANTLYDALFNPQSVVKPTRFETLQEFTHTGKTHNHNAIVGKIRNGENVFVKTGYKDK